jgi:hypothetical protein
MKTKIKKVYYCDFCGKHRLTSNSILDHEKTCTLNPERYCRLCETDHEYRKKGFDNDCPMCEFSRRRLAIKNGEIMNDYFILEEEVKKYWQKKAVTAEDEYNEWALYN